MRDARRGFDNEFEGDLLLTALCRLDRCHESVDRIDIGGASDFRDHDLIQSFAGILEKLHHVAIPVRRVEPVDPDRQRLGAPVDVTDGLDDVFPGLRLVIGRDGVFEVEVDDVCRTGRHLFEDLWTRSRAEQLAAVWTGRGGGLKAEAHMRNFLSYAVAARL